MISENPQAQKDEAIEADDWTQLNYETLLDYETPNTTPPESPGDPGDSDLEMLPDLVELNHDTGEEVVVFSTEKIMDKFVQISTEKERRPKPLTLELADQTKDDTQIQTMPVIFSNVADELKKFQDELKGVQDGVKVFQGATGSISPVYSSLNKTDVPQGDARARSASDDSWVVENPSRKVMVREQAEPFMVQAFKTIMGDRLLLPCAEDSKKKKKDVVVQAINLMNNYAMDREGRFHVLKELMCLFKNTDLCVDVKKEFVISMMDVFVDVLVNDQDWHNELHQWLRADASALMDFLYHTQPGAFHASGLVQIWWRSRRKPKSPPLGDRETTT